MFLESFVVCLNYRPPDGFDPSLLTPYLNVNNTQFSELKGVNRKVIPYLVCGDLGGWDSDTTYPLQVKTYSVYSILCLCIFKKNCY